MNMNLCLEGQKMHLAYKNLKTCSSYLTKRSSSDPAKITVETATSIYWPFFSTEPQSSGSFSSACSSGDH